MYQTSLVILAKGQIASFTFIGGSQEDIEKLVSNLSFGLASCALSYVNMTLMVVASAIIESLSMTRVSTR